MMTLAAITWRPVDIILIAVIAVVIAGAVILTIRRKKKSGYCRCRHTCGKA